MQLLRYIKFRPLLLHLNTKASICAMFLQVRQCESPPCEGGLSAQSRVCNPHPCRVNTGSGSTVEGQWSCWTEWSECSATCGVGVRTRTRECLGQESCNGPRLDRETCEMASCESLVGWDTWSRWTPCDGDHQQHRKRTCLQHGSGMCEGPTRETRDCLPDCMDNGEFIGRFKKSITIYKKIIKIYVIFIFLYDISKI